MYMWCSFCGSKAHVIDNCPKTARGSIRRMHMRCNYCGSKDHEVQACPKTVSGNAARAWNPKSVEQYFIKDR